MISKAVIPCGGLGTRFLPITKSVPKELLPIIDKPCLAYIADELIESGISRILLIISPSKEAIKNYFTFNSELDDKLRASGKTAEADLLKKISENVEIEFTYQKTPKGSGHAIYLAREFVGNDAFAIALGDDLICSDEPVTLQLIKAYEKTFAPIVGVQRFDSDDIVNYGVADIIYSQGKLHRCRELKEKPSLENLPSRLACLGRYVCTNDIFGILETQKPGRNGEIQLTDALNTLCSKELYAYEFEGKRYDMGDKFGALTATVDFGLKRYGNSFKEYLKNLITED